MQKNNTSVGSIINVAKIALGGLVILIAAGTASGTTETPQKQSSKQLHEASELLDSWHGEPQILEQAQKKLTQVLETDPQNYLALKEMARCLVMAGYINSRGVTYGTNFYQVGNYVPDTLNLAEAAVRESIKINPRFAEGYVYLGYIQFERTDLAGAEKSLTHAEQLGSDDPWLQLNWGSLNEARGEYSAAATRWQRVLKSGTTNPKALSAAYGFLIESYQRNGDQEKAVALYKDQIKRNPTNAWLHGNFAEYLTSTLGRNDEAIVQAREALKIMNYGMARRTLASALYRKWADMVVKGNDASAEKYFQEALEINPRLDQVMAYSASLPAGEHLAKALSTRKGVSIDSRAEDGSTALLIATNRGRTQLVQALLELNANPNLTDKNGWTPLLSAADEGNSDIVNMLLAKGADVTATMNGANAASLAEKKGNAELAALLRKRTAGVK
ncbi:MAG: ankyrin repeat domain-containing protein [Collimonas sp.]|uniref:ankyrin repeat domain-containing protein n=1 Tax=Collimonas sp. TaxID=1963772 RepID=UPI003265D671